MVLNITCDADVTHEVTYTLKKNIPHCAVMHKISTQGSQQNNLAFRVEGLTK